MMNNWGKVGEYQSDFLETYANFSPILFEILSRGFL